MRKLIWLTIPISFIVGLQILLAMISPLHLTDSTDIPGRYDIVFELSQEAHNINIPGPIVLDFMFRIVWGVFKYASFIILPTIAFYMSTKIDRIKEK